MQFLNSYFQIDFSYDGGTFSLIMSEPGGSFEGTYGAGWMNDIADRLAVSDYAGAKGTSVTVQAITYYGHGKEITVT